MKQRVYVTIDEDLLEKAKKSADGMGISLSALLEIGLMATIDRKALLKHTGGLFQQLLSLWSGSVAEDILKSNGAVKVEGSK